MKFRIFYALLMLLDVVFIGSRGTHTVLGLVACLYEHVTENEENPRIFQKIVIVLRCISLSTEASANVVYRPCPNAFVVAIPTRTNSLSTLFVV